MLRIISGLLLLIISQISFASVSTSNYSSTASNSILSATSTVGWYASTSFLSNFSSQNFSDPLTGCASLLAQLKSTSSNYYDGGGSTWNSDQTSYYCHIKYTTVSRSSTFYKRNYYSCFSPAFLSTSAGAASASGAYCTTIIHSCPNGGSLVNSMGVADPSGTICSIQVDSCSSYAGQSGYFWVNKVSPPSTICSGTCLASAAVVAGFPDADPLSWIYLQYTYTGETSGCSADSGFTDDATAAAANAAAAERERLAKIQKAIDDAIAACGGTGHYTRGTFNGNTVITCKESTANTTSNNSTTTNTTNNSDGSTTTTTTTTTNNNSTVNNSTSTTVNSDGSTTTTGGSSGSGGGTSGGSTAGTSNTTTTTTTTNPDGSQASTTSSASSTVLPGTGADYDYQDTDRNDWSSKNFQSVIESNIEKLKGTALYGSITGFFTVSFNGSCSASDFNTSYQGAELSASFDWCTSLSPYQIYIKAIVLFLCSFYAFRRAIE